jgi:hypothetical protein
MERKAVGVFHNPWRSDYDPRRSLSELYGRAVWLKANPRGEEYMRALFAERYPEGVFVTTAGGEDWRRAVAGADTVVLLYPDSIGIRFSAVEREVERARKTWATVRVLNGRRRDFVLSRTVRRELRRRRLAERAMLGEALAVVLFAAATPFFVASDLLRGRR